MRNVRLALIAIGAVLLCGSAGYFYSVWSPRAEKLEVYKLVLAGHYSPATPGSKAEMVQAKIAVDRARFVSVSGCLVAVVMISAGLRVRKSKESSQTV